MAMAVAVAVAPVLMIRRSEIVHQIRKTMTDRGHPHVLLNNVRSLVLSVVVTMMQNLAQS
jgi:hypothetical protein